MRLSCRFSVSLDDRIMSVTLPLFIDPGERIYVKAPLCAEVEATEVGLDAATSTLDSANSAVGEGGSACGNCTYINPSFFPICQMCGDALAVVSNPHTGAVRGAIRPCIYTRTNGSMARATSARAPSSCCPQTL